MKKFFLRITTLFTILLLLTINFSSIISSAQFADPDDVFDFLSPYAGSRVSGNTQVIFRLFDDDQSSIQFNAKLFDAATCQDINYGNIGTTGAVQSSLTQNAVFNWDTSRTQSNSFIADGEYCIKICASLVRDASPYSVCNAKKLYIVNNNSAPTINSFPTRLVFNEGETFSYQINASDPDGDKLTYRFVRTADFLSININTGAISSTPLSAGGYNSLIYPITVAVSDGLNNEVRQSFNIQINKVITTTPPSSGGSGTSNGGTTGNQTPDEQEPEEETPETDPDLLDENIYGFSFVNPQENEVFVKDKINIQWEINDLLDTLEKLEIEYSTDQSNWTQITNEIDPTRTYYLWDLNELEDGEYYFRISLYNNKNQVFREISPKFIVERETDEPEETESVPIIINLAPENESSLSQDDNLIFSADYIPSEGNEIDESTAEIFLNGRDYSESCTIENSGFSCTITEPVPGRQLVKATVEDTSGKTAEAEWTFDLNLENIDEEGEPTTPVQDEAEETVTILGNEISRSAAILALIILCIGSILIIVPWLLYALWGGDDDSTNSDEPKDGNGGDGFSINNIYNTTQPDNSNGNFGDYSQYDYTNDPVAQNNQYVTPIDNYSEPDNNLQPVYTEPTVEQNFYQQPETDLATITPSQEFNQGSLETQPNENEQSPTTTDQVNIDNVNIYNQPQEIQPYTMDNNPDQTQVNSDSNNMGSIQPYQTPEEIKD